MWFFMASRKRSPQPSNVSVDSLFISPLLLAGYIKSINRFWGFFLDPNSNPTCQLFRIFFHASIFQQCGVKFFFQIILQKQPTRFFSPVKLVCEVNLVVCHSISYSQKVHLIHTGQTRKLGVCKVLHQNPAMV